MDLPSEQQRRVRRGRQIVARQRELVAKLGERFSVAVALLETYEQTLRLFEQKLMLERREAIARAERPTPPNCVEAADAATREMTDQARTGEVAHLMAILRGGGFHCDLAQETLH